MHAPWPSHGAVLFWGKISGISLKINLKNEDTSVELGLLLRQVQGS
jgi:hypothetical protein